MKQLTKLTALVLALILLLSPLPAASAYGNCSKWAVQELNELESLGLLPQSLANADMTLSVTRGEMCQMILLAYTKLTGRTVQAQSTAYFKDTKDPTICAAYEIGLVNGYNDGTYRPDRLMTRQELFQILNNLFDSVGWTEDEIDTVFDSYTDAKQVGAWAVSSTKLMLELGVTNGVGNQRLAPASNTSIEQALIMFKRGYEYANTWFQVEVLGNEVPELETELPPLEDGEYYTKVSKWAKKDVDACFALGIVPEQLYGKDLTAFVSREQMCLIAVAAYQKITGDLHQSSYNYFTDTTNPAINLARENRIVDGYPDGTFRPYNLITRQEFFKIVSNFLHAVGWEDLDKAHELFAQFSDGGTVKAWAYSATRTMLTLGLIKGNNGKLRPEGTASRQEAAIIFYRGYKYIAMWYADHPLDPDTYPGHPHFSNPVALQIAELAKQQVGKPYVWGASGPNSFDCSGLTYWLYKQYGYTLYRVANDQWKNGIAVSKEDVQPGDILYFAYPGSSYIHHVGIYVGDNQWVHAANSKTGVVIVSFDDYYIKNYLYGIRRIIY